MKFSTRQDIDVPIDFVFSHVADFDSHERQALRRGIEVRRLDDLAAPGCGMQWQAQFKFRGKDRDVRGELTRYDMPDGFLIQSKSGGIIADFEVGLLPLSRNKTRIMAALDMRPKTITSRILVQSLKLAKSSLDDRFARRVARMAHDIQVRHDGPSRL